MTATLTPSIFGGVSTGGGGGGSVDSVTGLNTDNTDAANPVVKISVDGSTITGQGTPGSPLVASGGSVPSTVQPEVLQNQGAGLVATDTLKDASDVDVFNIPQRTIYNDQGQIVFTGFNAGSPFLPPVAEWGLDVERVLTFTQGGINDVELSEIYTLPNVFTQFLLSGFGNFDVKGFDGVPNVLGSISTVYVSNGQTGTTITLKNEASGTPADQQIKTLDGGDLVLENGDIAFLIWDGIYKVIFVNRAELPASVAGDIFQNVSGVITAQNFLNSSDGNKSVDFEARQLFNSVGNIIADWSEPNVMKLPWQTQSGVNAIPNVSSVYSCFSDDNDGSPNISEWKGTSARAMNEYYSGGSTRILQHVWGTSGAEPVGFANLLNDQSYAFSWSWDASDYGTQMMDHKIWLGGKQTYASPFAADGKIGVAIDGNAGLNNYYFTGVLDSTVTDGIYFNRITDENGTEFMVDHYLKGSGNSVAGGYSPGFQGMVSQLQSLTDGTDTGWSYQLREEAHARFQIAGDATYDCQLKDASGHLIAGMRGLRPVINSGNLYTGLPPGILLGWINFVDESGNDMYVQAFGF